MESAKSNPPIVCDMSAARDTGAERIAEYDALPDTAGLGPDVLHARYTKLGLQVID